MKLLKDRVFILIIISILFLLFLSVYSLINTDGLKIKNNNSSSTSVKAVITRPDGVDSQTKPETIVSVFSKLLKEGNYNQAKYLLTNNSTINIDDTDMMKFLGLYGNEVTIFSVDDTQFNNGTVTIKATFDQKGMKYKKIFTLVIEEAIWKIQDIKAVEKITQSVGVKTSDWINLVRQTYSLKYPKNWYVVGNTQSLVEIQSFSQKVKGLDSMPLNSTKIDIGYQVANEPVSVDEILKCSVIEGAECDTVDINGTEFKRLRANAGTNKNLIFLATVKGNNVYIITTSSYFEKGNENAKLLETVISTISLK